MHHCRLYFHLPFGNHSVIYINICSFSFSFFYFKNVDSMVKYGSFDDDIGGIAITGLGV